MRSTLRLLAIVAAGAVALAVVPHRAANRVLQAQGRLITEDGDTVVITPAMRRAGLRFDPGVAPADRRWILAALALARPEAARLVADVDGMVEVRTFASGAGALGITRAGPTGFVIDLDVARLDGDRAMDRNVVVLHELGHVIDFAIVEERLGAALDEGIPPSGSCDLIPNCDAPEERFADTFAKWALHGAVSELGAGYGIPMPASIEGWGEPLARLSWRLPAT